MPLNCIIRDTGNQRRLNHDQCCKTKTCNGENELQGLCYRRLRLHWLLPGQEAFAEGLHSPYNAQKHGYSPFLIHLSLFLYMFLSWFSQQICHGELQRIMPRWDSSRASLTRRRGWSCFRPIFTILMSSRRPSKGVNSYSMWRPPCITVRAFRQSDQIDLFMALNYFYMYIIISSLIVSMKIDSIRTPLKLQFLGQRALPCLALNQDQWGDSSTLPPSWLHPPWQMTGLVSRTPWMNLVGPLRTFHFLILILLSR